MALFELLESRRLLSATLDPVTKLLTVQGTNANDTITISQTSTQIKVVDNGVTKTFAVGGVNKIAVYARDGADRVTLEASVTKPSYLDSGLNSDGAVQSQIYNRPEEIKGGSGKDEIVLRSQEYAIAYGNGNDDIFTLYGHEVSARGGPGNDRFISFDGKSSARFVRGDEGTDTVDYSKGSAGLLVIGGTSGSAPQLAGGGLTDQFFSIENFAGTQGNDDITGTSAANKIWGHGGNDLIKGRAGNDFLYGGANDDALYGEDGDDYLQGDTGNDFLSGGANKDAMYGNDGNDTFYSKDSVADFLSGGNNTDKALAANRDAIDILNSIELT